MTVPDCSAVITLCTACVITAVLYYGQKCSVGISLLFVQVISGMFCDSAECACTVVSAVNIPNHKSVFTSRNMSKRQYCGSVYLSVYLAGSAIISLKSHNVESVRCCVISVLGAYASP